MDNKKTWVQGTTGANPSSWTTWWEVELGMGQVTHSILALPECPYPLLGRDFMAKMKAQIFFSDERAKLLHEDGKPV